MKKRTLNENDIIKFLFFLYLCGLSGHKSGVGFDAVFCRLTFVILVAAELIFILRQGKKKCISRSGVFILRLLLFVLYFFSVLWSQNIDDVFYPGIISSFIQIIFITLIMEVSILDAKECEQYLKLLLWSLIYMAILLILRTPFSVWGSERVGEALALNSNDIGMRCAGACILSLHFAQKNKVYYLIMVGFLTLSLFSGSRKALVMVLVGCVLYWCAKTKGWKMLGSILVATAFVMIVLYFVMNNELLYNVLGYRLEKALEFVSGNVTIDGSAKERAYYRQYAMSMFFNRPLLGYGGNGFVSEMRRIGYWHIAYSHCNYTELAATLGIVGVVLYLCVELKILFQSIKMWISKVDGRVVMVLALIASNLFAEYYCVSYYSPYTQIVIGLCAILIRKVKEERVCQKQ